MADEQDKPTKPSTPEEPDTFRNGYEAGMAHSRAVMREKALKGVGAVGILATAIVGVNAVASSDPLGTALNPDAQVSPDELAKEIVKDPKAYARFIEMKSFVEQLNKRVETQSRARFEGRGVE